MRPLLALEVLKLQVEALTEALDRLSPGGTAGIAARAYALGDAKNASPAALAELKAMEAAAKAPPH